MKSVIQFYRREVISKILEKSIKFLRDNQDNAIPKIQCKSRAVVKKINNVVRKNQQFKNAESDKINVLKKLIDSCAGCSNW